GFSGIEIGRSFQFALPLCAQPLLGRENTLERRDAWWLTVMGRLKPEWTIAQASEYFRAVSPGMFGATVPTGYSTTSTDRYRAFRLEAVSGATGISDLRTHYDRALWLLLAITGFVLLIACSNLANLML